MNDNPFTACTWLQIGGQADLAGSTTVDGATNEAEGLGLPDNHGVRSAFEIVHASPLLAREVAAGCDKWRVVKSRFTVGCRSQHHHVCIDGGDAEEHNGDSLEIEFGQGHFVQDLRCGRF